MAILSVPSEHHLNTRAGDLAVSAATLTPGAPCGAAQTLLIRNPDFPGIAIVQTDRVVGYIDRLGLLQRLADPIHHALFEHRSVELLMDKAPLLVDAATDIDDLAVRLVHEKPAALSAGFIVTKEGRYFGSPPDSI